MMARISGGIDSNGTVSITEGFGAIMSELMSELAASLRDFRVV